jgi:hypothetical protein
MGVIFRLAWGLGLRCCVKWDLFDLIDLSAGGAWRRRTAVRLYGRCWILRCRTYTRP